MPAKNVIPLAAGSDTVLVSSRALIGFPEAQAFFAALLDRGSMAATTAAYYVKLAARLRRQGILNTPDLITLVNEKTAANAYHTWIAQSYSTRIKLVQDAFLKHGVKLDKRVAYLRVGSLLPPSADKVLPGLVNPITHERETTIYNGWTLHVPKSDVPAHTDPCIECAILMPNDVQLEAIVTAFELAWGSREQFFKLPKDAYLFGTPPLSGFETVHEPLKAVRVAALSEKTTATEELSRVHAATTDRVDSFLHVMRDGVDAIYISRVACGDRLSDVLSAIGETWTNRTT